MLSYSKHKHASTQEWVTFVHGAAGSSATWSPQVEEFAKHYNVLVLDLRGHGNSSGLVEAGQKEYNFETLSEDIIEILDHEKVATSHFVGSSLGAIVIRQLGEKYPERIKSLLMVSAVLKFNFISRFILRTMYILRSLIPYSFLHWISALLVMPGKSHKQSRTIALEEAKRMNKKTYAKWLRLILDAHPLLGFFRGVELRLPTLYIMGKEDHLFLPPVKRVVKRHEFANLVVVDNSGHAVNIENPKVFNEKALRFMAGVE